MTTAGDIVTFRNGVPSNWKQAGYLRKIYLTMQGPTCTVPVIAVSECGFHGLEADSRTRGTKDPDGVLREMILRKDSGTLTVTLCAIPAQSLLASPCPGHRLIRVLRGTPALTVAQSAPEAFGPGTHVLLPKGAACAVDIVAGTVAIIADVTAD